MKVAVAVILNQQQDILITRRAMTGTHGGFWEFPGGKLEEDETPEAALLREIHEEVGLEITGFSPLIELTHRYDSKEVHLLVFLVHQFQGKADAQESQMDLRWVPLEQLTEFSFPAANREIIDCLMGRLKTFPISP